MLQKVREKKVKGQRVSQSFHLCPIKCVCESVCMRVCVSVALPLDKVSKVIDRDGRACLAATSKDMVNDGSSVVLR